MLWFKKHKPIHEVYPYIIDWKIGDDLSLAYSYGSYEWHDCWVLKNIFEDSIVVQRKYPKSHEVGHVLYYRSSKLSAYMNVRGKVFFIDKNVRVDKVANTRVANDYRQKPPEEEYQYYELLRGIHQAVKELKNESIS